MNMNLVLVKNVCQDDGVMDYKGLDINDIVPGTQLYPFDNTALFKYKGELVDSIDVEVIDQSRYDIEKSKLEKDKVDPIKELEQRLNLLQQAMDEMLLGGL
jgi:hypothetical protein